MMFEKSAELKMAIIKCFRNLFPLIFFSYKKKSLSGDNGKLDDTNKNIIGRKKIIQHAKKTHRRQDNNDWKICGAI